MAIEFEGNTFETNANGHLINPENWSKGLAGEIARSEDIAMTDRHWDVVNYLRSEFFDNRENQPNTRTMCKAMSKEWGEKVGSGDLYALFPRDPSKQAGKIGGLPESRRKGGY